MDIVHFLPFYISSDDDNAAKLPFRAGRLPPLKNKLADVRAAYTFVLYISPFLLYSEIE